MGLDHSLFHDPIWSAAIAAWLLVAVTAIAAGFGVPAAIAAAKTFRLESEPVILVRKAPTAVSVGLEPAAAAVLVVDGMPRVIDGIELRRARANDQNHPNAALAAGHKTTLEIHNAGRSPAVAVALPFSVTTPVSVDLHQIDPEELSGDRDLVGVGNIEVAGIGAGETVTAEITNLLGNAVVLKASELGMCLRIDGKKRVSRPLPVVALEEIILPAP
jgi:hypothetical protein